MLVDRSRNGCLIFILVDVDLIVASQRELKYKEIIHHVNKKVEIKKLGDATYHLGIQKEREVDGSYSQLERKDYGSCGDATPLLQHPWKQIY